MTENLEIGEKQHLIIKPGTRLRLGPDVSILSRGKVSIEGSADQPVVVKRLYKDRAWGSIIIQGPTSSGSKIIHARISGGTVANHFNIAYSGMISVHWSDDFTMEDSVISENALSDDTVHIVNSTFKLNRNKISNCFADCIDLDYSNGSIEKLDIENAGNDGIDFMGSDNELSVIRINRAKDKGLSVGEGSKIILRDVWVKGADIGIASKDRSDVKLEKAKLINNSTAIDVFAKNWRYGGPGAIEVSDTLFLNNQINLRTEEGGTAVFKGQPVPKEKVSGDGTVEERLKE